MLRVKLRHLDEWIQARQDHAIAYDADLNELPGLVSPHRAPNRTHTYHQYTARVLDDERSALQAFLKERGVGTEVYYPLPMHLQTVLLPEGYGPGDFPNAEQACSEVLSLPIFPEMLAAERDYVTASIKDFIFMKGTVAAQSQRDA